jgi:phage baseplate assembly protein W
MNRHTGTALSGMAHLRQSVTDILTTAIGSRVMRREYGSLLPELLDHPDNPATQVRLFAAIAGALMRWEPRLRLQQLHYTRTEPGRVTITLDGLYTEPALQRPQPLNLSLALDLPQRAGGAA